MNRTILITGVAFLAVAATAVRAEIIGDRDWRQLVDTAGLSNAQLQSVCGSGVCTGGTGALATLNGWRWASSDEARDLIEYLIEPGVTNLIPDPVIQGWYYYEAFDDPYLDAAIGASKFAPTELTATYERVSGWTRTCDGSGGCLFATLINAFDPSSYDTVGAGNSRTTWSWRGAWLYRGLAEVPLPGPLVLPDLNSDGVSELALVREQPIRAEVRSGADGSLLATIEFLDQSMTLVAAEVLPDSDGDGAVELAVLAGRDADGRGIVEMRNVIGAQAPRQVWFASGQRPVSLAVIAGDADANGVAELAVLSARRSDGRGLVEVKNAFGATTPTSIWVGAGLTPLDLDVVDDADANGVPEVAVLSSRDSDGRIVVEVKNAAGATNPNSVWFMAGNKAIDLAVLPDTNGDAIPELAVLSSRISDGRTVVEIKNADGPTSPSSVWSAAGQSGVAVDVIGDADGNGVPEVAVISTRGSDGRVLVEIKNARGPTNPISLWHPAGFMARAVGVLPDLDGNGAVEVGALLMRASDNRIVVQGRNASGVQSPRDYWFSP